MYRLVVEPRVSGFTKSWPLVTWVGQLRHGPHGGCEPDDFVSVRDYSRDVGTASTRTGLQVWAAGGLRVVQAVHRRRRVLFLVRPSLNEFPLSARMSASSRSSLRSRVPLTPPRPHLAIPFCRALLHPSQLSPVGRNQYRERDDSTGADGAAEAFVRFLRRRKQQNQRHAAADTSAHDARIFGELQLHQRHHSRELLPLACACVPHT